MIINRLEARHEIKSTNEKNYYLSIYEVVDKISGELISENRDLVNSVTLGQAPISALENKIIKIINNYNYKVVNRNRNELVKEVMDNIFGYGIMQKYLDIEGCNGVFINGPDNIWMQVGSTRSRIDDSFGNESNLISFIRTIQAKLGGEINENRPLAKFSDPIGKLRIVAGLPPVAMQPFVVFRKQPEEYYKLHDLVKLKMLPQDLAKELELYNRAGANIIFCGRGGAGKTTLMGALLDQAKEDVRMLLMQEQEEINIKHPNIIPMVVKRNEFGHVTDLLDISDKGLLMSIERYIFGEIRGGEALPLFKGALSGNVTMATTHSSSARNVIKMLMLNMKFAGTDINDKLLKEMLFDSVNIIVFLESFVVTEVVEIINEETEEKDKFNDLWTFDITKRESTFIEGVHRKVGKIKSQEMLRKIRIAKKIKELEIQEIRGEGLINA